MRHAVITDPPGRFGALSRLHCMTCTATVFTTKQGDDLQRMAYRDLSWHLVDPGERSIEVQAPGSEPIRLR